MSEKIAVHCETEEEWDRVQKKALRSGFKWLGEDVGVPWFPTSHYNVDNCIKLFSGSPMVYDPKQYWEKQGVDVISASEYLKGGENEVSEFKVGDRVREETVSNNFTGTIMFIDDYIHIKRDDGLTGFGHNKSWTTSGKRLSLIWQPTKTTKEETMNINDNVLEVFKEDAIMAGKIAKRFGDQYGTNDRDTLALNRDKVDLVAIIKTEEKEAAKKDK